MAYLDGLSYSCFHDDCDWCKDQLCGCACHFDDDEWGEEWPADVIAGGA